MASTKMELIGKSKNGLLVYYDPIHSHAATHLQDTPQLYNLASEALAGIILEDERIEEFPIDMGRIIGKADGVVNDPADEIVYAKRKNRTGYTPFNKSKMPAPSSFLVLSLLRMSNTKYELLSAFIGSSEASPPFPDDPNATAESKLYWKIHSLAWGTQEIQDDTLTSACPW